METATAQEVPEIVPIAAVTAHEEAETANIEAVTVHMYPFEPTADNHEKMTKLFLFESGFNPSDPHRLLKMVSETGKTVF